MIFPRERNFWGWGLTTVTTPEALVDLAVSYLSVRFQKELPKPRVCPALGGLRMLAPRVPVPPEFAPFATTDRFDRAAHTYGKAFRDVVRALSGDFSNAPDMVLYPETEADVLRILRVASARRMAVIPFGGGSSVVSGIEPTSDMGRNFNGVVSLDLCRLGRVLEVDHTSRTARIQAGAYGPAIENQLQKHLMTLRHFPQSFEFSTLGGWIATRAAGHFATLHTHIDDFVQSVRVMTPMGAVQTGFVPCDGAGPQQLRLFLGSEGILGVITEAWMRIQNRPRYRAHCTVHFANYDAGIEACRVVSQSGLFPANARYIDREEAMLMGAGDGVNHVLLLGFESHAFPQKDPLEQALSICEQRSGLPQKRIVVDQDDPQTAGSRDQSAQRWKESFFRAPYLRDQLIRRGVLCETFETCTTWTRFFDLDRVVRTEVNQILRVLGVPGMVTCRLTHLYPDGPVPYYTVLGAPAPELLLEAWDTVKERVNGILCNASAPITHHHAVGRTHAGAYARQGDPLVQTALKRVKEYLDPMGILNPGVLLR